MQILGIETSCDETAVSIIQMDGERCAILSEKISSQEIHAEYGGVVPELASREHLTNLPLIVHKAMESAGVQFKDINLIGVTSGPGLKGCLLVGLGYTKGVSFATGIPLLGVNHIEGHILSCIMDNPSLEFPFLCLVVSGGHTELLEVSDIGEYKVLGRTQDDSAGEAFDKSANLLGFTYPGGPS